MLFILLNAHKFSISWLSLELLCKLFFKLKNKKDVALIPVEW